MQNEFSGDTLTGPEYLLIIQTIGYEGQSTREETESNKDRHYYSKLETS